MTGFYDDLYEQPIAIRRTVEALTNNLAPVSEYAARIKNGEIQRVIFTGMGSSYAAATFCQLTLTKHNVMALAIESSELIVDHDYFLTPQTLIVAISQSGRSIEIIRLLDVLENLPAPAPVIGITNTVGSPLETRSTLALVTQATEEDSVSTKTYTCALAALNLLCCVLTGTPLDEMAKKLLQAADIIESNIPIWKQQATEIAEHIFPQMRFMEFIGRGSARTSALTAALITKETAKLPTEGMIGGQFRHGPVEVVDEKVAIVIFMGTGNARVLNDALAHDLVLRGGHVIAIGANVSTPSSINIPALEDNIATVVEIVPIQLLAAALATLRGFIPGNFRYSSKVTTTE